MTEDELDQLSESVCMLRGPSCFITMWIVWAALIPFIRVSFYTNFPKNESKTFE